MNRCRGRQGQKYPKEPGGFSWWEGCDLTVLTLAHELAGAWPVGLAACFIQQQSDQAAEVPCTYQPNVSGFGFRRLAGRDRVRNGREHLWDGMGWDGTGRLLCVCVCACVC